MATITQTGRPFRVATPLAPDTLLLERFAGTESVSAPYSFQLDLLSEQPDVASGDLLRKPVHITLELPDGSERVIHGLVNRFTQLPRRHALSAYRIEVVPWLWFLSLSRDCKIFQNMTVPEILEEVFKKLGYSDFDMKVNRSYPKREYCVQYRETHLNFVSRLMEEEGLFYFFEHTEDKHTLVIADGNSAVAPVDGESTVRVAPQEHEGESVVTSLTCEDVVHSAAFTLKEYDYLQPSLSLQSSIEGDGVGEVYDFLGNYASPDEGDRYARLQLEAEEARHRMVRGSATCRGFEGGRRFTLRDHYRDDLNVEYMLLQVTHWGTVGDYLSGGATAEYGNDFVAIPHSVPYRPVRGTPKPSVGGTQTALVVGPSGEEVYVDSHGRVKVQFHWDRYGSKNENSSCWVRVAQPWAGKGYGTAHIPRIGNEVVIEFLDGDPDRPLIIGSVYNADQTPPLGLPDAGIQMGIKSRSSKGGGGHNEITVTDTKGTELITIHGQYDMSTTVLHDETIDIGNDRTDSVGNDETISIGNNRTETVGNDETITIGSNRTEQVGADESIKIGKNRSRTVMIKDSIMVGAAQDITVGAAQKIAVGAAQTIVVGANQSTSVGNNQSSKVGSDRTAQVGKNDTLKVGKQLVIEAGDQIVIKTGKASITMKKDGTIQMTGKDITVKGSGKIDLKASKNVTVKGQKILQN
jgi:type VI secretion system secreted protein VgrG